MNTKKEMLYLQVECAESLAHRKDLLAKQELADRCQEFENTLPPDLADELITELYELLEDYTYLVNSQGNMLKKISIAHKALDEIYIRTDGALTSISGIFPQGKEDTWEYSPQNSYHQKIEDDNSGK